MITIIKEHEFKEFFEAYLECILWTTEPEELEDQKTIYEISKSSRRILEAHAFSFFSRCHYYVKSEWQTFSMLGHDFALTHQGHGAGFWGGGWPKYGDLLTKLSKCYPEEVDYESLFIE